MRFVDFLLKNLLRHRWRTSLTVLGVAVATAMIVALGLLTVGLTDTFQQFARPGDADFTVAKSGAADVVLSFLDVDEVERIDEIDGVAEVVPYVFGLGQSGDNPFFVVGGVEPSQIEVLGLGLGEGRAHASDNEIILGRVAARQAAVAVGDEIVVNEVGLTVVGIYESGITYQDSGGMTTITTAQRVQGIENQVNLVAVRVQDDADVREVADRVEASNSNFVSVVDIDDLDSAGESMRVLESFTYALSFLVILIGAVSVMNTIIMSVLERTKEIGVLRALGWSKARIVTMVVGEALLIGILAAVMGIGLGLLLVALVQQTDLGEAWLHPTYSPVVFFQALSVAVLVVVVASIYPAYRASRLLPTEALRHE